MDSRVTKEWAKLTVKPCVKGYFISIGQNNIPQHIHPDGFIRVLYHWKANWYIRTLVNNFNAFFDRKDDRIYFHNEDDAQRAVDYLNSLVVMELLSK